MKSHLFNARDTRHNKNEMKDNADKIDMKTNELKKMDGMEDIDRKKLEIIKKLNLRVRD